MPTLHLIRHGEPELTGVMLGHTDVSLSAAGREQMSRIRLGSVERIYCSPLRRCAESADILARGAIEVVAVPDLAEISFGSWDGLTWTEIERRWPAEANAKLRDWFGVTPPAGESRHSFIQRVDAVWDTVCSGSLPCAIVAHQAVNARLAHRVAGVEEMSFVQSYGEMRSYTF